MPIYSRFHDISQNLGGIHNIGWTEPRILQLTILSLISYFLGHINQITVHFYTHILFDPGLVLFLQISEVHVIREARRSPLFDELAHCGPPIFCHTGRHGVISIIHDIFFFHVVECCTGSCIQQRLRRFVLLQLWLTLHRAVLLKTEPLSTQLWFWSV